MRLPHATLLEIERVLLKPDGSHRDLDLEGLVWPGIQALVDALRAEFEAVTVGATSGDTETVQVQDVHAALRLVELGDGSAQLVFGCGRGCLTDLQFFVSHDGASGYGLQLTFFPENLSEAPPDGLAFIAWVHWIRETAKASCAYIRDYSLAFEHVDGEERVSIKTG
jgi:hypothetical protein